MGKFFRVSNVEHTEPFVVPKAYPDEVLERLDSNALSGVIPESHLCAVLNGQDVSLFADIALEVISRHVGLSLTGDYSFRGSSCRVSVTEMDEAYGTAEAIISAVTALFSVLVAMNELSRESGAERLSISLNVVSDDGVLVKKFSSDEKSFDPSLPFP